MVAIIESSQIRHREDRKKANHEAYDVDVHFVSCYRSKEEVF